MALVAAVSKSIQNFIGKQIGESRLFHGLGHVLRTHLIRTTAGLAIVLISTVMLWLFSPDRKSTAGVYDDPPLPAQPAARNLVVEETPDGKFYKIMNSPQTRYLTLRSLCIGARSSGRAGDEGALAR